MTFLADYAGFIPGVIVSLVVGSVLARRAGNTLGVSPVLGFGLVVSLGTVLSATITPSHEAIANHVLGSGVCDLTRDGLPSSNQLAWPSEVLLNILLFLPLGVVIGLSPSSRAKFAVGALALLLPFAIEGFQLIALPLGRACQSGDVIDNVTGLTLGILLASAVRWIVIAESRAYPVGVRIRCGLAGIATIVGLATAAALLLMPFSSVNPAPRFLPAAPTIPTASHTPGSSVRVTSIAALLTALANNSVTDIVVANGTYQVSAAASKAANSLWIGARFAGRTNPVTVRAETTGGVTFDGGGTTYFGGISFEEGAHDQTWQGFTFAHGEATDTGVVVLGGYAGLAAPHHITLRDISVDASVEPGGQGGDALSFSLGGPHDILVDGLAVDNPTHSLYSAIQFYHSDAANSNAWNVTIQRLWVNGTQEALVLWDPTLRKITVDTARISDALRVAVRYEAAGASGITLSNITSTGSGSGQGFHSPEGPRPTGVTFINDSFQ